MKTLKFFGHLIVMFFTCLAFFTALAAFSPLANFLGFVAALSSFLLFCFYLANDKKLYKLKNVLHIFVIAELSILAIVAFSRSARLITTVTMFLFPLAIELYFVKVILEEKKKDEENMDYDQPLN